MREGQRHHRRVGPPSTTHEMERHSSGHIPTHTTNSHYRRRDACSYSRAEVPMSLHPGRSSSSCTSSSQRVASKLLQLYCWAHYHHRHSNTVQACGQSSSRQPRLTSAANHRPSESKFRNDERQSANCTSSPFRSSKNHTYSHGSAPQMAQQQANRLPSNCGSTEHHDEPNFYAHRCHVTRCRIHTRVSELEHTRHIS